MDVFFSQLEGQENINIVVFFSSVKKKTVAFVGRWCVLSMGVFLNSTAADSLVLWFLLYNPHIPFILG